MTPSSLWFGQSGWPLPGLSSYLPEQAWPHGGGGAGCFRPFRSYGSSSPRDCSLQRFTDLRLTSAPVARRPRANSRRVESLVLTVRRYPAIDPDRMEGVVLNPEKQNGARLRRRWTAVDRFKMEAEGIEPSSENASRTTPTCVGASLGVDPGRRRAGRPGLYLLRSRGCRRSNGAHQPGFANRWQRPGRALVNGGASSEPEAQLTQPVPAQSWQLKRSRQFYQEPGPGHAAILSPNPSKPVAPRHQQI
jgi:hypothetical protein